MSFASRAFYFNIRHQWRIAISLTALMICQCVVYSQNAGFTYQGRLSSNGQPANGNYDLQFALTDAAVAGNHVGPTLTNAPVGITNGILTATLDFGATIFDGNSRWLEIGVRTNGSAGPYTLLSPRQPITTAPYATYSATSSSLIAGAAVAGNGAGITNINGVNIASGTIRSNQIDPATWQAATVTATNIVQAIGDQRYAGINFGRAWLTPYDCGAVGDGVADDTVAWQTFLNNATSSNLIAFVPPAVGPYYKITDSLVITNLHGLKLIGAGGAFHTSSPNLSRAQLRQFTAGKHGIVIADGPGGPTDSIHIEGLVVKAQTFSPASYGIAFNGNVADSDCDIIQECGIQGFGVGLYIGSAADLSVISCSFGSNGDGIQLALNDSQGTPSVINSVKVQTSQLSYNYSNQVNVLNGFLVLDTCDIASGALLNGDWAAHGVRIDTNGWVDVRWCNFENYGTNPAVAVNNGVVRISGGRIGRASGGPNTYAVVLTNSYAYFKEFASYSYASDGFLILEVNNDTGNPQAISDLPIPEKFIANNVIYTNYLGPYPTVFDGRSYTPQNRGQFVITQSSTQDTALLFAASLTSFYGSNNVSTVDLLQYQKDKTTAAAFNTVSAANGFRICGISWTTGGGSPEGVVIAPVGSIYTRTNGGPGSTLYIKESGEGNTGWTAK